MNYDAHSRAYKPRYSVFSNIRYKHAILTKAALIAALTFVAVWFTFFSQLSFGMENTDRDGNLLPSETGDTSEETTNLSVPDAMSESEATTSKSYPQTDEARESTIKHALREETSHGLGRVETTGHSRGAQNLQQERGDVKWNCEKLPKITTLSQSVSSLGVLGQNPQSSSAASTFKPEGAACPQSVASPAQSVFQEEKISGGELYARLVWEHVPKWKEPSINDL